MVRPGKYFQFPLQKCTTRAAERKREWEREGEGQHRQRIALFSSIMKIKFFISMHSQSVRQSGPCVEESALLGLPMNAAKRLLHIFAKLS